ncbi:MAG TPA: 50S ribosomal protein L5 [Chthoniobacterales bacterium]
MAATLLTEYRERVIPALKEARGYKNVHQIPKISKVVINTSIASQSDVKQALEDAKNELALITGQKAAETVAKKSISNFKLRQGQAIGAKVTLRGERMYEFLERLIRTALPRIRDFRGISPRAFDGNGNYTLGVIDQSIFPEVELDKVKRNIGFDVTIVTTAKTNEEAKALLTELGVPFTDKAKKPVAKAA